MTGFAVASPHIWRRHMVTPEFYGASESAADNGAAFLAAMSDSNAPIVDGRGRTYAITSQIAMTDWARALMNCTFNVAGGSSTFQPLLLSGTDYTAPRALASDVAAGDVSIPVTAGHEADFAAGDLVLISSDEGYTSTDGGRTADTAAEHAYVASTASGSVTLESPLRDDYATADTATIRKVQSTASGVLDNVKFIGDAAKTQEGPRLIRPNGARLFGVTGENVTERLISIAAGYGCEIDGTRGEGINNSGLGYIVSVTGSHACRVGSIWYKDARHGFASGGLGSGLGANTPDNMIARDVLLGDVVGVDSSSSLVDTHGGIVDFVFGNVSGNMRDGVSQEVVTLQGARITGGDIAVRMANNHGILCQSFGHGESGSNYFRLGHVSIQADGAAPSSAYSGAYIANKSHAGDAIDEVAFASLDCSGPNGVRLLPDNGNIERFTVNGGHIHATTGNALRVDDSASYRVTELVSNAADWISDIASGTGYALYLPTTSNTPTGPFVTVATFNGGKIEATARGTVCRSPSSLVVFNGARLIGDGTEDMFAADASGNGTTAVSIDGQAFIQSTLSSGSLEIWPGALHVVASESGTADDLDSITVSPWRFNNGGSYAVARMDKIPVRATLVAASGDTITAKHSAADGDILTPYEVDTPFTDKHAVEIVFEPVSKSNILFAASALATIRPTTVNLQSGGAVQVAGVVSIDGDRGVHTQTATGAEIADIADAVNTTNKTAGKMIFDTTDTRLMVAAGATAASPWHVADGSASVTPS